MKINYTAIRNSIYTTLKTNAKLDPANIVDRYIVQMIKQRWIPSAGLPAVQIYLENKPDEPHRAIGYAPFPNLIYTVKTVIGLPVNLNNGIEETPTALLTAIGIPSIQTPEHADDALAEITDTIEEVIRGDSGALAINRYLNNNQIKVCLPISTDFNFVKSENAYYIFSEVRLQIQMRLT